MDEIEISDAFHFLYEAVFCTFGSWSDLCTTDCRLVLRQFTGSAIDPFGLPNNHLLLCSSRLFLLLCLHRLLRNIRRERVFEKENVTLLRVISWLCIAVGVVTLVSGLYYTSFFLVAAAAAFCGLIVRVVKNVFEQAIAIKTENDYTI
ncbi:DUF2975 domain-containing protein [Anaeromassilibacillus sp. SJQ-1]|uniref:DUF2975 domain-containing protein n=1 Tax=Anaeromassilibacillus sp. SJQ-1 TaxID=3375419 RepID=UPI003989315B